MFKTNIYNNSKTSKVLLSKFFNYVSSSLQIKATNCKFDLYSFGPFLNAFERHHKLKISSRTQSSTFCSMFIYYCAIVLSHDSSFVDYVYNKNTYLNVPSNFVVHMLKVSLKANSSNKLIGYTTGELTSPITIDDIITSLNGLDITKFKSTLIGTGFEGLFDLPYGTNTKSLLINTIKTESKRFSNIHDFILFGATLPLTLVLFPKDLETFQGYIKFSTSPHLGIYRFRNYLHEDTFVANQTSVERLEISTLEMFSNYLFLFKPEFILGDKKLSEAGTTDVILDVGILQPVDVWFNYLSYIHLPNDPTHSSSTLVNSNSDSEDQPSNTQRDKFNAPSNHKVLGVCTNGIFYLPYGKRIDIPIQQYFKVSKAFNNSQYFELNSG